MNFTCDKVHKYQCGNFKCIPRYYVCNGEDNCGDGSDENNMTLCANRPKTCPNIFSDFKCANGNCVDRSKICDLSDDCGDRTDEKGCHEIGKCDDEVEGTRGGCQHRCNNLPGGGYLCLCDRGYVVNPNNPKKCIDIDECASFGHNCSQICTNMNGTYSCSCRDGFDLSDQFSGVCRAVKGGEAKVLFTTGSEIRGQVIESTNNRRTFEVIKNETRITGLDYNPKTMMLYLADSQEREIKRSFLPGTSGAMIGSSQTIIKVEGKTTVPTDVASDWLSGNIYWTESKEGGMGTIMVAMEDGRYRRSIVTTDIEYPTSIAVDPEHGLMYWTDAGNNPKIETAWMDGSKRRAIVTTNIAQPEAITIDYAMDHTIYWLDSKLGTIEVMDHDGQNRHVVLRGSSLKKPVSLDIFESNMFWVNGENGAIVQQDKFGRGVPVTLARNLPNPRSVKVLHQFRYNSTIHDSCKDRHCSHLCVIVPGGRARCECPDGQGFVDRQQSICDAGTTEI
jgi:low density lipoprotein-related protein 2